MVYHFRFHGRRAGQADSTTVTVVTHCCHIIVCMIAIFKLLLHCCYTIVTPLLHNCSHHLFHTVGGADRQTVQVDENAHQMGTRKHLLFSHCYSVVTLITLLLVVTVLMQCWLHCRYINRYIVVTLLLQCCYICLIAVTLLTSLFILFPLLSECLLKVKLIKFLIR
jgi:hypothetical protein